MPQPHRRRTRTAHSAPQVLEARALLAAVHADFSAAFNQDSIRNRVDGVDDLDDAGIDPGSRLVTDSYAQHYSPATGNGLPDDGAFAANALHPHIQLGYRNSDNGSNVVLLDQPNESSEVSVPERTYDELHVFALSTNGSSDIRVVLNYADRSSVRHTTVSDWFDEVSDGARVGDAIQYSLIDGMDRHDGLWRDVNDPAVFGLRFAVDSTRDLRSFRVIQNSGGSTSLVILGATLNTNTPHTFVVDTHVDESDGDYSAGDLSLREALLLADQRPGEDRVTFDPAISGSTIGLSSPLSPRSNVEVVGPGASHLTIDGSEVIGTVGSFFIQDHSVGISGLTITGAVVDFGGGIVQESGELTLDGVRITGNRANSGGGIWSAGRLDVLNSTIDDNLGSHGTGGIVTLGHTTIQNTTISGNTGFHGGVLVGDNALATITNSTIVGNRGVNGAGGIDFQTSAGAATLFNTIVAGNVAGAIGSSPGDIPASQLTALSEHNLIGDADSAGGLTDGVKGNIVGLNGAGVRSLHTIVSPILQNNGGQVPTHALNPTSPAIDAGVGLRATDGDGELLTTDGRGGPYTRFGRLSGQAAVDIGAYEAQPLFVVNTAEDVAAVDTFSIRDAVTAANLQETAPGIADEIRFDESLNGQTIELSGVEIRVVDSVSIIGPGPDKLTISGEDASRVFHLGDSSGSATYVIEGLALTEGNGAGAADSGLGGALFFHDSEDNDALNLYQIHIDHSTALGGGAIYAIGGTIDIEESRFSHNTATGQHALHYGGGALALRSSVATLTEVIIQENTSAASGGGIHSFVWRHDPSPVDSELTVIDSQFLQNEAKGAGGGVLTWGQHDDAAAGMTVVATTFFQNSGVDGPGGGIALFEGNALISTSLFHENGAIGGGGLYVADGEAQVDNTTFSGNGSRYNACQDVCSGGAIMNEAYADANSSVAIVNSTLADNVGLHHTAIHNTARAGATATVTYANSIFSDPLTHTPNIGTTGDGTHSVTSLGNNISNDASGNLIQPLDQPSTNPLLAPLADNGGLTLTHAIAAGSPAHEQGSNALAVDADGHPLEFDGRDFGYDRFFGSSVDIGAFELGAGFQIDNHILFIEATDGPDTVVVRKADTQLKVDAVFNGTPVQRFFDLSEIGGIFIDGYAGDDDLRIFSTVDLPTTLYGSAGDDLLRGGSGHDLIEGEAGNDTIQGGAGDDELLGGEGNDLIKGGAGNDEIAAFFGDNIIQGNDGDDFIETGAGADQIRSHAGHDRVHSGAGADTVKTGGGDDTVLAGAGDDFVASGSQDDDVDGGEGNDELRSGNNSDIVRGGPGNDTVVGGRGRDTILGQTGDDLLLGNTGTDLLVGGDGDDMLLGHTEADVAIGGDGVDTLKAGSADDLLIPGLTIFDRDVPALSSILSEWISGRDYVHRVANLRDGSSGLNRQNINNFLDRNRTVFDDDETDALKGGSQQDWFFARLGHGASADVTEDILGDELLDELFG